MTDPAADSRPGRHCYKCGRPIGPDETICATCNRAGMATPAATQVHATMVVALVAGVLLLALWAGLSQRGHGPFEVTVTHITDSPPDGARVSLSVTNLGSAASRASCQLTARDAQGAVLRSVVTLTPSIDPGAAASVEERMAGLASLPAEVEVHCT